MRIGSRRRVRIGKIAVALILVQMLSGVCAAQYRSSSYERKTTPRALGVLEQLPNGKNRLFPVSIFLDGKYYDARFYYAKPVPLSLYDETEYVALKDGMPVGQFTVHTAQQVPETTIWWGIGDWKAQSAEDESQKPATAKGDEGRPVLKKPSLESEKKSAATSGSSGAKDEAGAKSGGSVKPDDDQDRPVLRKPKEGKTQPQVTETTGEVSHVDTSENDPNRPVLRRQQPVKKNEEPETLTAPKRGDKGAKYLVAISDPDTMNNRPYDYEWTPAEKTKWTEQLSKMAMETLRKYSGTQSPARLQPNAKFAETSVRAFDLDYSNQPYIIFTGRVDPTMEPTAKKEQSGTPQKLAIFYVTVVARLNSQDQLNQLLASASDSSHMDLNPRLELIDAVDANGDNRAELLFRKLTQNSGSYVLYQMTPFQMTQVFEGGSGN